MQTKLNMSEKYQYKVVRTKQEIDGITYTISGTGGADDVLTFEDTAKYE